MYIIPAKETAKSWALLLDNRPERNKCRITKKSNRSILANELIFSSIVCATKIQFYAEFHLSSLNRLLAKIAEIVSNQNKVFQCSPLF